MKKNKIITSLLSITSVAAMVAPVAVSCKNDVKQCKITLSDSCSQAFKLTVTRIPANHDLSAKIYCAPNYRPSDSSEVTITVGRKTLDKSKNEYRYDLLPGRYDGPYYLLSIPAEYVTDDIVIDVNNLVEVVPVELDDVYVRHYIEPFPVASIGSTQTITIMNWENSYIMPFNYNDQNREIYYGQALTYVDNPNVELKPNEWRYNKDNKFFTSETKIDIYLSKQLPGTQITIWAWGSKPKPETNTVGQDHLGDPCYEGENFEIVENWENKQVTINLIGETATTEMFTTTPTVSVWEPRNQTDLITAGACKVTPSEDGQSITLDFSARCVEMLVAYEYYFPIHIEFQTAAKE